MVKEREGKAKEVVKSTERMMSISRMKERKWKTLEREWRLGTTSLQ